MNKSLLKYLLLFVAVALSGYFTQKVCYREPSLAEAEAYVAKNMSYAKDVSIEETERADIGKVFKITYTDESGEKRVHGITRAKAWVWPFTDYDFKND